MLTLSTLLWQTFCMVTAKRKKKSSYHHGNLRQALIEAGLDLIEKKGIKSLTLREIGASAGVSRMAPYRHFADKAALLAAISEAGFVQFGDALLAAKARAGPGARAQLSAMGVAYVRLAAEHHAHYEVMFSAATEVSEPLRAASEAARRAFLILEQTIREGQQEGVMQAGDSVTMARVVWAQVHGISTLRLYSDPCGPEGMGFLDFSSRVLQAGLAPARS